eukprot:TRINITY_DN16213_c2_g1_i1.p3 TRINITY_DN16213_c2_g1~~TRINITY_DN16213_c2_g1_i1.p3  ORF type:complete len:157 (-),score=14.95 TRINITY_DN16213_c2_g1_i1:279-749(-)
MSQTHHLFQDIFEITDKDTDGKYFDKVSRYVCKSDLYGADMQIDINSDIYPLQLHSRYAVLITQSLVPDIKMQLDEYDPDLLNGVKPSLLEDYEYVMHGMVYKLGKKTEDGTTRAVLNVSYGGLLMQLVADSNKLSKFEMDSMVYFLMRKAQQQSS